jgi:hypothetical protein
MRIIEKIINNRKLSLVLLSVIVFIGFFNIFFNGFVIDDNNTILTWQDTRSLTNIPKMLLGATPLGHEGVYRPLRGVLYLIYYQFFNTNAFFYHMHGLKYYQPFLFI